MPRSWGKHILTTKCTNGACTQEPSHVATVRVETKSISAHALVGKVLKLCVTSWLPGFARVPYYAPSPCPSLPQGPTQCTIVVHMYVICLELSEENEVGPDCRQNTTFW